MSRLSSRILLCIISFAVLILSPSLVQAQRAPRLARPTNLKFSGESLTWDSVPNAWRYQIRWSENGGSWRNARVSARRKTYAIPRPAPNTVTIIQVRALARSSSDYRDSLWSSRFTLRVAGEPPTATETPLPILPRPRGFRRTTGSTFVWNQLTGASAYEIAWQAPGDEDWDDLIIGKSQFHYTIRGLQLGVLYHVRLRGLADGLVFQPEGAWTGVLTLTLPAPTDTPTHTPEPTATPDMKLPALPAPTNVRLISGGFIAWDPVPKAFEYRLRWIDTEGEKTVVKVGISANPQYLPTGLTPGLTYQVQVQTLGDNQIYRRRGAWSGAALGAKPSP